MDETVSGVSAGADPGSAEKDKTAETEDEQKEKRREGGAEETQGCGEIKR